MLTKDHVNPLCNYMSLCNLNYLQNIFLNQSYYKRKGLQHLKIQSSTLLHDLENSFKLKYVKNV